MFSLLLPAVLLFLAFVSAWVSGSKILPSASRPSSFFAGLLFFLSIQSLAQTAMYYASVSLGTMTDVLSGIVAFGGCVAVAFFCRSRDTGDLSSKDPSGVGSLYHGNDMISVFCLILIAICSWFILSSAETHATVVPIRSTWNALPNSVIASFALSLFGLIFLARLSARRWILALATSCVLFSLASIPILLYPLGYGFDGFLHRASEKVLLESGTLHPKPLYYIGQYVFVTWASRVFGIAHGFIDIWLVPVALAIVPWTTLPGALLVFLLPLASLLVTTPQAFAYLLGFMAIALAYRRASPVFTIALATWALATHPLAGLPLLVLVVLIHVRTWWIRAPLAIASVISVPCAFAWNALATSNLENWNLSRLFSWHIWSAWASSVVLPPALHIDVLADGYVFIEYLAPLIITLFVLVALFKRGTDSSLRALGVVAFGFALASPALSAMGDFSFLIDYERQNYATRLSVLAFLVACFPAMEGFRALFAERKTQHTRIALTALIVFATYAGTARIVLSLPRHDVATISRAWSVGRDDIEAVSAIERDAKGAPYTVLANQNVSAVAVDRLGFKRYNGDVFFYPIPTGGPLYALFLQMMKEPDAEIAREAGVLGGTKLVYVVLNKYWWDADRVRNVLDSIGTPLSSMKDTSVTVYRFDVDALRITSSITSP